MDGTSTVVLIILIMFFMNQPWKQPAGTADAKTSTEYTYVDRSEFRYQNVSYDRMEAIIRKYNKKLSSSEADRIKIAVNNYCKEKDLDPRLILALMARESAFDPNTVSTSGAIGLGQIMPFNYTQLGISNPRDIDQNAKGVVYYLNEKLNDWKGNVNQLGLGLASYLRGTGEIKRNGGTYSGHAETYVNDILRIRGQI